jgi:uncharacterized protein YjbI with pentapeptide repeats
MIEIKHRYTNAVLFCGDFANMQLAVEAAIKEKVSLDYADLSNTRFDGTSFVGTRFVGTSFVGTSFVGTSFVGTRFVGTRFVDTSFDDTRFDGTSFVGTRFDGTSFVGTSFVGTRFDGTSFVGTRFDGTSFVGTRFDGNPITKQPIYISGFPWSVTILQHCMLIGCQHHSHAEWANLGEDIIEDAGGKKAVELWAIYKSILLALCAEQAK